MLKDIWLLTTGLLLMGATNFVPEGNPIATHLAFFLAGGLMWGSSFRLAKALG